VALAAVHAAASWPEAGIAVAVADLPALTAPAVDLVLAAAQTVELGVVVDRQGLGTTMLTARPGHPLHPRFGPGSARRHVELGANRLGAPQSARTDVDVLEDLDVAQRLGFGPAMAALFRAGELPLMPARRHD
jgi:2-phospho-L-lactate guanylyltransferase